MINFIFNRQLFRKFIRSPLHRVKRYETTVLQYDLSQEIIVKQCERVLTIGLNYPDVSNTLNDNALDQLNEKLNYFNDNDDYSVAILHGIGGNFCTGLQESASLEKAENLLKTLKDLKKPTIACLTGYTCFYGFQLAILCDFRIMESSAFLGIGHGIIKGTLFPIAKERLLKYFNTQCVLALVLNGGLLNHSESFGCGLVQKWTEVGTGLGKSVGFAASIAKHPLNEIIEERALIYSLVNEKFSVSK